MLGQLANLCAHRHTVHTPNEASAHVHACVLGMLCNDLVHACMHIPLGPPESSHRQTALTAGYGGRAAQGWGCQGYGCGDPKAA